MIIERRKLVEKLSASPAWTLVYGRRKTGKSFLLERFVDHDEYYFVKQDKAVLAKKAGKTLAYDAFLERLEADLTAKKTVVVDEFHRLGPDFADRLHGLKKQGRLILVSSTLNLARSWFSPHSALLGFFQEIQVGLIDLDDALEATKKLGLDAKSRVELAVLLREPLAAQYVQPDSHARKLFTQVLEGSLRTIPALVGEIFAEEQRGISAVYEGILRAVANGKAVSGEISSALFSRKLIAKDDPSLIQQYLNNLISFGILKRIAVYGKNRFMYRHASALSWMFYYADEKYNASEGISENALEGIVENVLPRIMEDVLREYIAQKKGLQQTVIQGADFDVDACLLKFKKPVLAVEIKWKKIDSKDVRDAEKNLGHVPGVEKWLFVPDKTNAPESTEVKLVDMTDLGDAMDP